MKFLWLASSLLFLLVVSIQGFQFGTYHASLRPMHRVGTASTRQWTLKEPDAEVDTNDKVFMEAQEEEESEQEEVSSPDENVPDLSPSEDSEELSRDEEFMRMAIELAEEE